MKYFDVFYQEGENPVFCYRTGLTVYEEQLIGGVLVSAGWNTAGYPLGVLSNYPSRIDPQNYAKPFAFELEVNGQSVAYDLKFVDFLTEKTEKNIHATLVLESNLLPLSIKIHTLLDGTAMFTRWLEIKNNSDDIMRLSRIVIMGGGIESRSECTYSIGYFDNNEWAREGQFVWKPLAENLTVVDRGFYCDRYRHPMLLLKNEQTGTLWFSQMGWSGGCRFGVDRRLYQNGAENSPLLSHLSFFAEVTGYAPLLSLLPSEEFSLPEIHIGAVQGGLDDAVYHMHEHIRRSVISLDAPCLIGAGMGAEHDMSVATSKAFIDQFADMGAEVFIIDAGWQNAPGEERKWNLYNGINYPNADRYPNGLEELCDYCHEKGMKFGLWVEIERIADFAPMYKEHPEWRADNIFGVHDNRLIDFSNPQVAKWAEDELTRIISDYKLDLLRIDYNVRQTTYFGISEAHGAGKECLSLHHFAAVYRMYENLKKKFPHVVFENCAGGGGRTDLGMMKNFHHTWVSDWQKLPRSVSITNGMTMALPPERVDRLFAGMGCHEVGGVDAHMRNVLLGHVSLNVISCAAIPPNPLVMEFVKHSTDVYKEFIRPMLAHCTSYHHTPEVSDLVVQEIATDKSGAITIIALEGQKEVRVRCKGMKPSKKYRVTLDNSGDTFVINGSDELILQLPSAMTSELVLYTIES